MPLALITVHRDYLSTWASCSFLPTLREASAAVTPSFPSPRQRPAPSSVFCVHPVWYCIKAIHGSAWTKSNLSQKNGQIWMSFLKLVQRPLTSLKAWTLLRGKTFSPAPTPHPHPQPLAMQDWRLNTGKKMQGPECIAWRSLDCVSCIEKDWFKTEVNSQRSINIYYFNMVYL